MCSRTLSSYWAAKDVKDVLFDIFSPQKIACIVPKNSYETESLGVLKYGTATNILWKSCLQLTNHILNNLLEMLAFVDLNSQHPTLQLQPTWSDTLPLPGSCLLA